MKHSEQGFVTLILLALLALATAGGVYVAHGGNQGGRSRKAPEHTIEQPNGPTNPIPEPSSIALFGVGAALVGYAVYKKQ